MLVSAVHPSQSATCIHISPPSWTFLPLHTPFHSSRSSQSTQLSFLWFTAASHHLFYPRFYIYIYICPEKATAPHSSTLTWKIPWTEEPGRLQSMGSLGVGHDWATSLSLFTFMHWRRKWQPTPVFLPREFQGQRSLAGCRLWGRTESVTTEAT